MLVVIDIGNTNIVLGTFEGERLTHSWRVSTRRDQTPHEYAVLCRNLFLMDGVPAERVSGVAISSVVPPLNDSFTHLATEYFGVEPFYIDPVLQGLMPIRYLHPSEVGADRIVNGREARELHGAPAIVVDFGTATTFDAVSTEGEYLGGAIAPGIGISAEALFVRAARLPRIEIIQPDRSIGRTTVESMQAGIFYGYVGLVDGVLSRMKKELPGAVVTATGGYAPLIAAEFEGFDHLEQDLTLHGLSICYRRMSA